MNNKSDSQLLAEALVREATLREELATEQARIPELIHLRAQVELQRDALEQRLNTSDQLAATAFDASQASVAALQAENEVLLKGLRGKNALTGATYKHLIDERDGLQLSLSAANQRNEELRRELAEVHAVSEPAGENTLWEVLDAAVGVLTRRAAPHAWESEAHQAGLKVILARRAGLAATHLKPATEGESHE